MNKNIVLIGSALIVIAIVLGAFGAHSLEKVLLPEQLDSFETGVRYQMYNGLALLILGFNFEKLGGITSWFIRLLLVGVVLFSGSIYLLSLQDVIGITLRFLGPITPIGGSLMIIAWIILIIHLMKLNVKK